MLASADPASWKPARTFPAKIDCLPRRTRFVLADADYDIHNFAEAVEGNRQRRRSHRHFVCPMIERHRKHPRPTRTERGQRRLRREQRRQFLQTRTARRLLARRTATVEPFSDWLKSRFDLHDRVWHRRLDNNRTQFLTAIFCYQLLLHLNRRPNGQIQSNDRIPSDAG